MTAMEIIELRNEGHLEEAYDAVRVLFKTDKGPETSLVMFWTAIDILKKRMDEGRMDEAGKIFPSLWISDRTMPILRMKTAALNR